jgi:hypothetical protein
MTRGTSLPTQDEVLEYFDVLSNWGRWAPTTSAAR